ncbi:MAG: tRNA (adenosine(37)-N6)-threonylcarbamoyltransferase complex dimerization subunit type 1 TsaB [Pseudomonadota bacterium]
MTEKACILALDAAGNACSAALWSGGAVRARRLETMERGQSERLVPMIEDVMTEAAVGYDQLTLVAVTVGPGGFTGVRIGLATARAIALACACPAMGVTTFEAAAAAVDAEERQGLPLVALIESKRKELYAQTVWRPGDSPGDPAALLPEQLAGALPSGPLLLVGDGAERGAEALRRAGRMDLTVRAHGPIDAAVLAQLAAERPLPPHGALPPAPLYLRAPDVTPGRRSPSP